MIFTNDSWYRRSDSFVAAVFSALFVAFCFSLDFFYRISADDYSGIDYAMDGIPGLGYAWRFYWNWEGPFLCMVLQGLLMYGFAVGVPAFFLLGSVKIAMVAANYVLLSALSERYELNWSMAMRVWAAVVFAMTLYLISPETSQIWHWAIGSVYLFPLIFVQIGVALLLRDRILWAAVPLAFVVQSRATYSVIFFGALFLLMVFKWISKSPGKKDWLLLCGILFLFLSLYLIAPGNYARMNDDEFTLAHLTGQFKRGLENLIISYNIAKLDRVLLAVMSLMPLIVGMPKKRLPSKFIHWALPAVLYLAFILVHEFLFVAITGYCEWTRVLSLHSFLFLVTGIVYGLWIGDLLFSNAQKIVRSLSFIGMIGILIYQFSGFGQEITMARQFSIEYDNRMENIMQYQGNDTLLIEPIAYHGVLYFEDFSEDPDHWINGDFRKAYDLDFKVAIKTDE